MSTFLSLLARPLATAVRGAALAGLAATYRDTALASESLYRRQVLHSSEPLLSSQPISRQQAADAAAADSEPCAYPLLDVASLPDSQFLNAGSSASGGQRLDLDEELMDKATAWMQVLPPHIEMSYVLMTGVHLFPPTEAVYTTYVDWDAALRHLDRHRSPHRLRELRRLVSKQDKFELESWNPAYVGRA